MFSSFCCSSIFSISSLLICSAIFKKFAYFMIFSSFSVSRYCANGSASEYFSIVVFNLFFGVNNICISFKCMCLYTLNVFSSYVLLGLKSTSLYSSKNSGIFSKSNPMYFKLSAINSFSLVSLGIFSPPNLFFYIC